MATDDQKYPGPAGFVRDGSIVPWGKGNGTESIVGSLTATNGFAQEARDEAIAAQAIYRVVRRKSDGTDYMYGARRFLRIANSDQYHFLRAGGFIAAAHGAAKPVEDNLLAFIRNECKVGAAEGAVDDIVPPPVA